MNIINWKGRFRKGISYLIFGFFIGLLLDYFWADIHWQQSIFRSEALIRLGVFFLVGFLMTPKTSIDRQ